MKQTLAQSWTCVGQSPAAEVTPAVIQGGGSQGVTMRLGGNNVICNNIWH